MFFLLKLGSAFIFPACYYFITISSRNNEKYSSSDELIFNVGVDNDGVWSKQNNHSGDFIWQHRELAVRALQSRWNQQQSFFIVWVSRDYWSQRPSLGKSSARFFTVEWRHFILSGALESKRGAMKNKVDEILSLGSPPTRWTMRCAAPAESLNWPRTGRKGCCLRCREFSLSAAAAADPVDKEKGLFSLFSAGGLPMSCTHVWEGALRIPAWRGALAITNDTRALFLIHELAKDTDQYRFVLWMRPSTSIHSRLSRSFSESNTLKHFAATF